MHQFPNGQDKIAVIGLGYVGIPLLLEILKISEKRNIVGFDIDKSKIDFLVNNGNLSEFGSDVYIDNMKGSNSLKITSNESDLRDTRIFIVTVPTPINEFNVPDLTALKSASSLIGKVLNQSDIKNDNICVAIYESTVYPGATEDVCYHHIKDFAGDAINHLRLGYSPERINPGDQKNTITTIKKVTSGQDDDTSKWVDDFYKQFVKAGTFNVGNIKVAEASKVIENTQRDLNIALANELALICSRLDIDTNDVLDAACTKWNFMNIRPGLVGGHCIGVDPYYLAHKAEAVGIHSKVILSGRQVNDGMPGWIARRAIKKTVVSIGVGKPIKSLILGMTFKENCEDIRNSKAIELFNCLQSYGSMVHITDPLLDSLNPPEIEIQAISDFLVDLETVKKHHYDLIILAVAHDKYRNLSKEEILSLGHAKSVYFDLKNCFPRTLHNLVRL